MLIAVVLTVALGSSLGSVRAGELPSLPTPAYDQQTEELIADWYTQGDQGGDDYGYSVHGAGDVNNDGYDDVIVGAPLYNDEVYKGGAVFVFYGSSSGLATTPSWTFGGDQKGANFGHAVAAAGDVNDDGYDDVIVGAYRYKNGESEEGRAYVFRGSDAGPSSVPDWTFEIDQAGDVNNDGYDDVIVGARWYDNAESFGINEGAAFVFHGSDAGLSLTPDWSAAAEQSGAGFGTAVGAAGDVDGDDYDDVIVGAPQYDNGHEDEGAAFIYLGSVAGLAGSHDWFVAGDSEDASFGASVAGAGDVNGDGYDDVIVGAPTYTSDEENELNEGAAFVFFGSAAGTLATPHWQRESNQQGALYGTSVATAGDINNDGYDDVLIGAPMYDDDQRDEGGAFVFYGFTAGVWTATDWHAHGGKNETMFGTSVHSAGDVDGDGYADVVVGSPEYRHNLTLLGRAFGYYGKDGGPAYSQYLPLLMTSP